MNIDLLKYYANKFFESDDYSSQCLYVRNTFSNSDTSIASVSSVLNYLCEQEILEQDTRTFLKMGVAPHPGSEGLVLDIGLEEESKFWNVLCEKFPKDGILLAILAECLYLNGNVDGALPIFIESFKCHPENLVCLEGSIYDAFENTKLEKEYVKLDIELGLANGIYESQDLVQDHLPWIREKFEKDKGFVNEIEELLRV